MINIPLNIPLICSKKVNKQKNKENNNLTTCSLFYETEKSKNIKKLLQDTFCNEKQVLFHVYQSFNEDIRIICKYQEDIISTVLTSFYVDLEKNIIDIANIMIETVKE